MSDPTEEALRARRAALVKEKTELEGTLRALKKQVAARRTTRGPARAAVRSSLWLAASQLEDTRKKLDAMQLELTQINALLGTGRAAFAGEMKLLRQIAKVAERYLYAEGEAAGEAAGDELEVLIARYKREEGD